MVDREPLLTMSSFEQNNLPVESLKLNKIQNDYGRLTKPPEKMFLSVAKFTGWLLGLKFEAPIFAETIASKRMDI